MPFGFFVTTPFFLAGVMLMMGERRWKYILAVTILIFGLIIVVFMKFLYVPLPMGTVQLAYDINNFFLVKIR
jgi:cytochrome c oxidase subunit IV